MTLLVLRVLLSLSVGEIFCRLMVFYHVYEFLSLPEQYVCFANSGILTAIFILFYFVISKRVINKALLKIGEIEVIFSRFTLKELVAFVVSAVIGLIFAYCLGIVLSQFSFFGPLAYMFLNITMAYLACVLFGHKINEVGFGKERYFATGGSKAEKVPVLRPKILDTSVIIDGRILDILRTGFIEGRILIPNFVLDELRHIADSADPLKRNRGRRGLDILNEIQKQSVTMVKIADWSGDDNSEVDVKLIKMAEKYNAYVVTNDFNLNKVAEFTGVSVLNINELSNAVKPIVLPGEDLCVEIVKDGKGNGQGIGYLNDGTMIVIEGGYKHIGETLDVLVTSILQTAAGRMIFTRIKSEA